MAKKYGQALAEVKVYINGKEQAKRDLDELKEKAEAFSKEIKEAGKLKNEATARQNKARKRANAATEGSEEYTKAVYDMLEEQKIIDEQTKKITAQKGERKQLLKVIRETEKFSKDIAEDLDNLSGQSIQRLKEMIRQLDAIRTKLKPEQDPDGKFLNLLNEAITEASETVKNKKGDLIEFSDIMDDLTNIDDTSLEKAEQRLRSLLAATDKDDVERIKQLREELNQVTGEKNRRLGVQAESIMGGDYTKTIEGTKEAIDLLEKYKLTLDTTDAEGLKKVETAIAEMNKELMEAQKSNAMETLTKNLNESSTQQIKQSVDILIKYRETLKPLSPEWQKVNDAIETGKEKLKSLVDQTKLQAMTAQYKNLGDLSKSALSNQKKYWQEMVDGAAAGSKELAEYEKRLAKVVAEEQKRAKEQAGKVMNNLSGYSVDEIKEAIKATEQLRDAQKPGSKAWAEYAAQVKNANDYLDSFKNKAQFEAMNTQFKNLSKLSADALAEQKKYWQAMVNGADNGSKELEKYKEKLAEVTEEERRRAAVNVKDIMKNPDGYSVEEIKEAIKVTEQLRDAQVPGSKAWKEYAAQVENANGVIKKYNDNAKMEHMLKQLENVGKLSKSALAEQKKFWQEMADGADRGSAKLSKYEENLAKATAEDQKRIREDGGKVLSDVLSHSWKGTVGEAKEAIELLKQYKETLDTTDTKGIENVGAAIDALTKKTEVAIKKADDHKKKVVDIHEEWEEMLSRDQAFEMAESVKKGLFDGTEKDIRKAIKALKEYKSNLRFESDKKEIEHTVESLKLLEKQARESGSSVRSMTKILIDLPHASMEELEFAAEELKKELHGATRHLGDYDAKARQLRDVTRELDRVKKEWHGQENAISRVIKRLTAYVAVYGSYNFISGKVKEMIQGNLELSDSLADIQKTTGLSAESVAKLSDQINAIDTRTAQKELHDLAYEAGKLGISAEEDVLAFVRAGNQLLVALGEDLGGAEAVRQLMKVNAILGETQELGVEKALLATGSAINEISQTTRASAGPIADMVSRIGAIGAAARLGMADLVALAGTADAAGQSAEVSATAFNKFITTLTSNPVDVAYALGMDPARLKSLMSSGNTIQAIIDIFERMNLKGDMADLGPIMGELGSEGARMTQVLTTMASQVEELKAQVFTSNRAFEEATSVTNEYNIKNESAAAIAQRFGNNIREYFVKSGFVEWLKEVLQWLYYFPNVLERNRSLLLLVRVIIWEIISLSVVKWIRDVVKNLDRLTIRLGINSATWGKTYMQVAKSKLAVEAVAGAEAMATRKALLHANALKKLQIGFITLGKVIAKSPVFLIGTAIAATIAIIQMFTDKTDKAKKAVQEFQTALSKERLELDSLRIRIDRANRSNGERAALIQELNKKYGQYLGFMVTESNYADNQKYIYSLLNNELERTIALKMREKMTDDIADKYADNQKKYYSDIKSILNDIRGIGEGGAPDILNNIMDGIREQISVGKKDIDSLLSEVTTIMRQAAIDNLQQNVEQGLVTEGSKVYAQMELLAKNLKPGNNLREAVEELFDIEKNIAAEISDAEQLSLSVISSLEKRTIQIKKNEAERILGLIENETNPKKLQEYESKLKSITNERIVSVNSLIGRQRDLNSLSEEEQELFESVSQKMRDGVSLTEAETEKYKLLISSKQESLGLTEEELDTLQKMNGEVGKYNKGIDIVQGKLAAAGKLNLWGDGKTIKDVDVNQLVSMYKRLESDAAKLAKGAVESIQTQYWKGFDDHKSAIEYYRKEAKAIKDELDERGFNTSGKFKWDGGGNPSTREEYRAAIAALEAFYKERETVIIENGRKQNALQSTIDREIAANEDLMKFDRAKLRQLLLGEDSDFDPNDYKGYKGLVTENIFFGDKKNLEYLRGLAQRIKDEGIAVEEGIRNQLASDLLAIEEMVRKQKQKIDKLLLEDDFTEKVAQQYLEALDNLGLLFNASSEAFASMSEDEGRKRLAVMSKFAKDSYDINATRLQKLMEEDELFSDWTYDRSKEDYEALLIQLRKFNDDMIEADKKAANRRRRIFEASKTGIDIKEREKEATRAAETEASMWERFSNLSLVSQTTLTNAQIELYRAKIEASQEYIEQIRREMDAEMTKASTAVMAAKQAVDMKKLAGIDASKEEAVLAEKQMYFDSLVAQNKQLIFNEEQKIDEARASMTEQFMAAEQEKLSELKKYTDAFQQYAYDVGYAMVDEEATIEDARKAFIKTMLTTLKDYIQIKTTELVMNQLFAKKSVETTAQQTGTEMGIKAAETEADVAAGVASASAKEAGKKGLAGLLIGAAIGAALNLLLGAALAKIDKVKAITGTGNRGLSTGMLTYAEGNYPVLGNDGKVYDAKYEGAGMKTGIYGGGAHFGIFSEKQPEMIVDGKTTQKLILNYPYIYDAITTIAKNGRLVNAMPTFASGDYPAGTNRIAQVEAVDISGGSNEDMIQMRATMEETREVNRQLLAILSSGRIVAHLDGLETHRQQKKNERFLNRRGIN